jgi:hypothetical protein
MKKSKKGHSLKDRLNKSYESRDKGGISRQSALDWKKVKDAKFYEPTAKRNRINIIPYIVKTKNDPLVASGDVEVKHLGTHDAESYMLDIWIHTYVGSTGAEIVCLKSNYNKPCPICKKAQEFKDAGKKEEASALWPKRRCYYNVIDMKNPDEGIQIFNVSHFLFEKELIEQARADADDGDIVDFVDINDGKEIEFRGSEVEKVINNHKSNYLEFKNFTFIEREEALDPDLVEQAISFDTLIKLKTPDEIEKILFDEDSAEDDDEPKKSSKKSPTKKKSIEDDDDEDEEDEEDDEDDEEEDSDEDNEESDDDTDEEDEEETDDEEEDSDDDDDDDDDDEPIVKKPVKKPAKAPTKKPEVKKKK